MGYRQVMGASNYRSWKNWSVGDSIEGVLQSITQDQFGKPNYTIKVIACNFENKDENIEVGANFTLNSNGALDYAVNAGINKGDTFKVIYKGEDVMTKGKFKGKKFHKLEVLVKDAAVVEGAELVGAGATDDDLLG